MATAAFMVRERPPPLHSELLSRPDICFCHPGFDPPGNELLTLPRVDSTVAAGVYGVHHRTALLACQIIAGNAFDSSRFTFDREGQHEVQVPLDGVLIHEQYYFIVPGSSPYPIVPSFQDWEFPHRRIPDFWPSTILDAPDLSTNACSLSAATLAVDKAHLIPKEERTWFSDNGMAIYGVSFSDIDNPVNTLPLRKDLHYNFDNRLFAITPKIVQVGTEIATSSIQYVTHILDRSAAELWPVYHNKLVGCLHVSSPAYIFARFAWAVLLRVKEFVAAGHNEVLVFQISKNVGRKEWKVVSFSGQALISKYGGGGSQPATPMKKRIRQISTADSEEYYMESSSEGSDTSMVTNGSWDEWEGKGRRRKQKSSDETVPDAEKNLASDVEADLRIVLDKVILEQQTTAPMEDSGEEEIA